MQDMLANLQSVPGYLLLGLVAYCDTLVGIGFFVFGEAAFFAAGASLAATGQAWPVAVVMVCAWAGDVTSYWIGRRYSSDLSIRYLNRLRRRRAWRRARAALDRRGAVFVVVSRLTGPTAWITPLLAGSMGMKPGTFASASAIGVLIGVGQFILLGALGFQGLSFLGDHAWSIALIIVLLGAAVFVWRRAKGGHPMRLVKAASVAAMLFLASNLAYFFLLDSHGGDAPPKQELTSACGMRDHALLAYPGHTAMHLPQPVNVILLSNGKGSDLMTALGWHRNQTFSRNSIGFGDFLWMLAKNTPPVSELFLDDQPVDSAFQMPGTIMEREHIRWWNLGPGLSVGAVSRDDELEVKYYRNLPVLMHDIDPLVDGSRDLLAGQVIASEKYDVVGYSTLGTSVPEGARADFETDGRVLVVAERGMPVGPETHGCLEITPVEGEGRLPSRVL